MPQPTLIHDSLTAAATRTPEKAFLICGASTWSYAQVDAASTALAGGLIERGVRPGEKVAILLDNAAEAVISLYGVSKAAATFVMINSTVKAAKLRHLLSDSEATVLIAHTAKGRVVLEAVGGLRKGPAVVWVSPNESVPAALRETTRSYRWDALLTPATLGAATLPRAGAQDLAALVYTSGSTGQAKGVMQPHHKMIAVAGSIIRYLDNRPDDVILNVLSLSFGYGLYQVLMAAMFGGTVVLEKGFVYLHETLGKIHRYGVTGLPVVPTVLAMMLNLRQWDKYDFLSLRYITNAGDALPGHYTAVLRQRLPRVKLFPMYGLTECVRVSYLDPGLVDRYPDSVGTEIPDCRCRAFVVDDAGTPLTDGAVGELVITGDNVMDGYYNAPEATARVFRGGPDGGVHLYTGDLFRRNEAGLLVFVGRKGEMIKTRGERVSPREVENGLLDIDGVAEAAVVGIPDALLGQAILAFIVPAEGAALTEQKILAACTRRMENYLVPKAVEFMTALPKTANGKVDRKALREITP